MCVIIERDCNLIKDKKKKLLQMRPSSGVCRCLSVARWSPRIARKTRFSGVITVVFIELRISEIGNWTELAHFQQVVRAFNNYSL